MEAHLLQQALLDQRAFAAAFDATFVQARRDLASAQQLAGELRRQFAAPALADLPRVAAQAEATSRQLGGWLQRFQGRTDQAGLLRLRRKGEGSRTSTHQGISAECLNICCCC